MHRLQYVDVFDTDNDQAREREQMAIDMSIGLMETADSRGSSAVDQAMAVAFTSKLWSMLLEDLAHPDNALPKDLRAQIISIGIWMLREMESIRTGATKGFADAIAVSRAIRDGLA